MYNGIELLIRTIDECDDDDDFGNAEFGEKLLSVTLDFLHRTTQNATSLLQEARSTGEAQLKINKTEICYLFTLKQNKN